MMRLFFNFGFIALFINLLSFSAKAQCTIPNGGFTDWVDMAPTGWFGFPLEQIAGRTGGGSALRINSSTGLPFPSILGAAFPCSVRSNFLNGFVKSNFQGSPQDTLVFIVFFKKQGSEDLGAFGSCQLSQTISNWTPFHIALNNLSSGPVDSMYFNILKIGPGTSTVDFDDFSFSNTATGQTLGTCQQFTSNAPTFFSKKEDLKVFPNPANGEIKVSGLNLAHGYAFEILNLSGQTLIQGRKDEKMNAEEAISTQSLQAGIYILKVKTKGKVWVKKIQIQ